MKNALRRTYSSNVSLGFQSIRDKYLPGEMIKAKVTEKALGALSGFIFGIKFSQSAAKLKSPPHANTFANTLPLQINGMPPSTPVHTRRYFQ